MIPERELVEVFAEAVQVMLYDPVLPEVRLRVNHDGLLIISQDVLHVTFSVFEPFE